MDLIIMLITEVAVLGAAIKYLKSDIQDLKKSIKQIPVMKTNMGFILTDVRDIQTKINNGISDKLIRIDERVKVLWEDRGDTK